VPGCALTIERVFRSASFPEDVFRTLLAGTASVEAAIEHPGIAAVTLTGSPAAGRAVARKAGEMLKKTVLELGGSDAYVVLADADLAHAVEASVTSRLINGGQSCVAAKRFVVVRSVLPEFTARFVETMRGKRMGDPLDESSDIGPLARHDLRDALHRQVLGSLERGARCLLGGRLPEGPGAFYPPTVLADVVPGMPAYEEELFGPVAAIIPARDDEDALRIANDSAYGLGAAVFTRDVARGQEIAWHGLEAGCCFVNDFVRSDPRLPFGGVKRSGYGRELGPWGLREFVNIKTIYVK
jgi:succinate-semialdehyde dehydrogenase/glutarate-semialdehyde dehydrogenase